MSNVTMQHTPGPWCKRGQRIVAGNVVIAATKSATGHVTAGMAENNARLIAAAPDLLEALRDMTDRYEALLIDSRITKRDAEAMRKLNPHRDEIIAARAAIAKATGEQS